MRKITGVALIAMFLVIVGCGTTASTISKEKIEEGVILQTAQIDRSKVDFQDNSELEDSNDIIYSHVDSGVGAAESDALIEVFNQPKFTNAYKISSVIAQEDGTFLITIPKEDRYRTDTMYVTATAPGKSRSAAIIFTR